MKRFLIAAVVGGAIVTMAAPSHAQLEGNLGALTGDNAKGYLQPLSTALSTSLNMAAFQTGSIPKAGFNLTVGVHVMAVAFEDEDRTYRPTDPPGFTSTGPVDAPTVVGSETSVQQAGAGGTTLYHPGGFNLDQFTIAVPQVSVGSVMGTRAVVRWISLDLGDADLGKLDLLGVGVQHSLSQYFPNLPVDLAVGGMYQTFQIGDDELIDMKAFHAEVTASKKFMWLQPYLAVGFDRATMEANYEQDLGSTTEKVNVKFDDESSPHFTAGLLLGLPMVKLHLQFDAAEQTGAAAGLRFGLGN